jgi:teichuronic acid biosynthesis glycosyltransferase TuaG
MLGEDKTRTAAINTGSTVSVIIPTCNRASQLGDAIVSALSQTVPPLEVLVCDDGSTDGSDAVVRSFNDPRVKWLPGCHAGRPAVPRNRGLAQSEGEWIAFLDSDDRWVPDKLEKQLGSIRRSRCAAGCSNAQRIQLISPSTSRFLTWNKPRVTFDDLLYTNYVVCSSAVIHRSLVPYVLGFPEDPLLTALEDYALWLRVATRTDFAYISEPLVLYQDHPTSLRSKATEDLALQKRRVFNDVINWGNKSSIPVPQIVKARRAQFPYGFCTCARRLKHFLLRIKAQIIL